MRSLRCAVFVDAGYIFGQGGVSLTGASVSRTQLRLNEAEIINQLKAIAGSGGMSLLRIYWYDGAKSGMTVEQTTLAEMADVKVRLGSINVAGHQKGVDSLLVTDLIDLARNQAIADAYVVTGDGDMRIALQIAQSFGVRAHLINLEPAGVSLNPQLKQEADTFFEINKSDVAKFLQVKPLQPVVLSGLAAASGVVTVESATKQALKTVFANTPDGDLQHLKSAVLSAKQIPQEYDRRVLGTCGALLGRPLDNQERAEMRKITLRWIEEQ
ncbi:MAG TPA: NYN domain-containing protein [Acidobacteriaceae bacterium]